MTQSAPDLQAFQHWLQSHLTGEFAALQGQRNQVDHVAQRRAWEQALGQAGYVAIGWPVAHGGRGASIAQQVLFAEAYARAKGPPRVGHLGVELLGPTLITHGTPDQQRRFLPGIVQGRVIWCQGYSEPGAGSDLANIRTKAVLADGVYRIHGQKIWTSMGSIADWCFVLVRTEPGSVGSQGLSFLLVDLRQPGVEVRPIRQMTGEAEFAEVFFDGAIARAADRVGAEGEGWKIAMALLGFERGVSTLGQQMLFQNEFNDIVAAARANGMANDQLIRQRLAHAYAGLRIMRASALRMLQGAESGVLSPQAYTYKLFWSSWHRDLGELAMDVLGQAGEIALPDGRMAPLPAMFLMSRADTIYAGTNQIQRNIIAERALNLPREPRGA